MKSLHKKIVDTDLKLGAENISSVFCKGGGVGVEFGEGDATKQKSVKRSTFSLNEGKAFSE